MAVSIYTDLPSHRTKYLPTEKAMPFSTYAQIGAQQQARGDKLLGDIDSLGLESAGIYSDVPKVQDAIAGYGQKRDELATKFMSGEIDYNKASLGMRKLKQEYAGAKALIEEAKTREGEFNKYVEDFGEQYKTTPGVLALKVAEEKYKFNTTPMGRNTPVEAVPAPTVYDAKETSDMTQQAIKGINEDLIKAGKWGKDVNFNPYTSGWGLVDVYGRTSEEAFDIMKGRLGHLAASEAEIAASQVFNQALRTINPKTGKVYTEEEAMQKAAIRRQEELNWYEKAEDGTIQLREGTTMADMVMAGTKSADMVRLDRTKEKIKDDAGLAKHQWALENDLPNIRFTDVGLEAATVVGKNNNEVSASINTYQDNINKTIEGVEKELGIPMSSTGATNGTDYFNYLLSLSDEDRVDSQGNIIDVSIIKNAKSQYEFNNDMLSLSKQKDTEANEYAGIDKTNIEKVQKLPEIPGYTKTEVFELVSLYNEANPAQGDLVLPGSAIEKKKFEARNNPRYDEAKKLYTTKGGLLNKKENFTSITAYEDYIGENVPKKDEYLEKTSSTITDTYSDWMLPGTTKDQAVKLRKAFSQTIKDPTKWKDYPLQLDSKAKEIFGGAQTLGELAQKKGIDLTDAKQFSVDGNSSSITKQPLTSTGNHAFAIPITIGDKHMHVFLPVASEDQGGITTPELERVKQTPQFKSNVIYNQGVRENLKSWSPSSLSNYGVKFNYSNDEIVINNKRYKKDKGLELVTDIYKLNSLGITNKNAVLKALNDVQ